MYISYARLHTKRDKGNPSWCMPNAEETIFHCWADRSIFRRKPQHFFTLKTYPLTLLYKYFNIGFYDKEVLLLYHCWILRDPKLVIRLGLSLEKLSSVTTPSPVRVCSSAPVLGSQSLIVLSLEPEASSRPSGEKATDATQLEWPSRACNSELQDSCILGSLYIQLARSRLNLCLIIDFLGANPSPDE